MGWVYAVLLAGAVAVLVAAEWPRLSARLGLAGRAPRVRAPGRRKAPHLTVVPNDDREAEEFAAAIERDLEQLPTIDERN